MLLYTHLPVMMSVHLCQFRHLYLHFNNTAPPCSLPCPFLRSCLASCSEVLVFILNIISALHVSPFLLLMHVFLIALIFRYNRKTSVIKTSRAYINILLPIKFHFLFIFPCSCLLIVLSSSITEGRSSGGFFLTILSFLLLLNIVSLF